MSTGISDKVAIHFTSVEQLIERLNNWVFLETASSLTCILILFTPTCPEKNAKFLWQVVSFLKDSSTDLSFRRAIPAVILIEVPAGKPVMDFQLIWKTKQYQYQSLSSNPWAVYRGFSEISVLSNVCLYTHDL